jgi:hypothetical protein
MPIRTLSELRDTVSGLPSRQEEYMGAMHRYIRTQSVLVLIEELVNVQHSDDKAVDSFAHVMKAKLEVSRRKGRGGWEDCDPEDLSKMLWEHMDKGDPVDVANFAMMIHLLGASIGRNPAESLDLEVLLSKYHETVWEAGRLTDSDARVDYDKAGVLLAKDIIKLHKAVTANLQDALNQLKEAQGWKEAVLDALVINHSLTINHERDPRKALADLIAIECKMALDPSISVEAGQGNFELFGYSYRHDFEHDNGIDKNYQDFRTADWGHPDTFGRKIWDVQRVYRVVKEGKHPALVWLPIADIKDKYIPGMFLYGPELVCPDFNPEGVVEGHWVDDIGWQGAVWNGYNDEWETKTINPTHFMLKPKAPGN